MRKYEKQQILDLITTIHSAHIEIKKLIEKSNYSMANDLLIQSQEAAISIGNAIENSEGEGLKVITYIEEYCELLYEISTSLTAIRNPNKEYKKLKKLMLRIEENIKTEIQVKLEIVFLPYKASMWDSLESIWIAAKNDENCECFVIPIPYFDRGSNGEFTKMHYEGDDFPDYVPITHYSCYDLKIRKPDIIYFHNPFDGYNLVTSVHPDYYSENLKKNTDLLIYSPYFISGMYRKKENFINKVLIPGVINADKIIVQSKEQYNLYLEGGFKPEKLLLCGSPKVDAYVNLRREHVVIPKEWMEKIKGKKVIALNSSIGNLLRKKDYLDNLESIINKIISKEEIILLWRPHPLLKSTIESMRKHWLERYINIERKMIENDNVIYDTTPDNRSATIISDGLISDISSWTRQYLLTGKPVLYIYGNRQYFEECIPTFDDSVAYFIKDGMSIELFCEKIITNEDGEKEIRLKKLYESMENMDGTCGKKVHALVKEEMKL